MSATTDEVSQGAGRSWLLQLARTGRALALIWRSAPGWTVASGVLIGVQSAVVLGSLYLLKLIVDAIAQGAGSGTEPGGAFDRVLLLLAVTAAVAVAGVAARALAGFAAEAQAQLVTDYMLDRLQEKSVAVDYAYYEDPRFHDTLHLAQQEAPYRPTQLLAHLTQVIQSGVTAAGILVLLVSVHWILALAILAAVVPTLFVQMAHSRRFHRWRERRTDTERRAAYFSWLIGDAQHAKELRLFDLGRELMARSRALRTQLRTERLTLARANKLATGATEALATVIVFGSLAFIGFQTFQGVITLGALVMYFGAVQRGQTLFQSLFSGLGKLYEDNLFLANVERFLQLEPTIRPPASPRPVPARLQTGLRCNGVSFRYPTGSRLILDDVCLEVGPGEVVALVGPNGSGKTTLTKLLCRLYDPADGSITLDGMDLREFDPAMLRRKFSYVFQDFGRYSVTAHDNIRFGNVRGRDDAGDVRSAAQSAGVHDAIERLGQGYDTVLGRVFAEAEELSVGEWQKLAIARSFFSDAEILVVDEPTSALDASAEIEVVRALLRLFRDRSALVISHRLATVRLADRIYFLDDGTIVEQGTHDELMERGGRYASLFQLQAQPYQMHAALADSLPVAGAP